VVEAINARGFGLTFGMHSRIDDRVAQVTTAIHVGNIYVNRNQIGAVVGVQPFGGEGLSGTGPKAGGPHYLPRFLRPRLATGAAPSGPKADPAQVQALLDATWVTPTCLDARQMPGPTGESNRLSLYPRGVILCLGPTVDQADRQARIAHNQGCRPVIVAAGAIGAGTVNGHLPREALRDLRGFDAVALWSEPADQRAARIALAAREGPLIPLLTEADFAPRCVIERHVCIDTTAAGGNATLLADVS